MTIKEREEFNVLVDECVGLGERIKTEKGEESLAVAAEFYNKMLTEKELTIADLKKLKAFLEDLLK